MEEIMRSLNDVVVSGQVRYIGASSMLATEFAELQFIAKQNGWFQFINVQSYYNVLNREDENELIPFCKKHGVGLTVWSPNARGVLTRPADKTGTRMLSDPTFIKMGLDKLDESDKEIIGVVEAIAKKKGISMAMVSMAWILNKGANAIAGLNSIERVDEAIRAIDVKFTVEELELLEKPYKPKRRVV